MPQPRAPQPPVAGQQHGMAGPVPRMPAAVPPRMAEPGPQAVAVARPPGAGDGLGRPAQAMAPGNNSSIKNVKDYCCYCFCLTGVTPC